VGPVVVSVEPHLFNPFEPLSEDEVRQAAEAIRSDARYSGSHRFVTAATREPSKAADADPGDRRAEVVVVDRATGLTSEVVVDLRRGAVVDWIDLPDCHASYLLEEFAAATEVIKADPRWCRALAERGVADIDAVQHDPWPAGNFGTESEQGRRIMRVVAYLRHGESDNGYAHPIEGLVATVDVTTREVLEIVDERGAPLPPECGRYDEAAVGGFRSGLKPLEVVQRDGPGFEVDGYRITWENWRFAVSMHPLDALVLHQVGWEDAGRHRSILRRASLAEMVVPYGDPGVGHRWKNAFDSGEIGMGRFPFVNSLRLGCDCLGEIHYLDAVQISERGRPQRIENAICIHEEDYGILWKHTDLSTFSVEVRRSRRLVVSSIHTVGNYEYGFYWYFYLDGTIQLEIKLTGILQTKAVGDSDSALLHCSPIGPQLAAPYHQHLFCFRLDLDVDGPGHQSVEEIELAAADSSAAGNELGGVMVLRRTPLATELRARRVADSARGRTWKVINRSVLNRLGQPVGYRLVPGSCPTLLAQPGSAVAKRAAFATHNLWVTPYAPAEMRAAGYPVCAPGGGGLPSFVAADRNVRDTDVVLWHTFGVNHVPRPEDWPVMPVEYAGFSLVPSGFFDRNPALDVPPHDRVNGHCH
jgi:primary-amine oxidase